MGLSASSSSYRPAQPETLTTGVISRWVSHSPPHSLSFRPRFRRERSIPSRRERVKRIVLYAVLAIASWNSAARTTNIVRTPGGWVGFLRVSWVRLAGLERQIPDRIPPFDIGFHRKVF